jgi:hypothetical protein
MGEFTPGGVGQRTVETPTIVPPGESYVFYVLRVPLMLLQLVLTGATLESNAWANGGPRLIS